MIYLMHSTTNGTARLISSRLTKFARYAFWSGDSELRKGVISYNFNVRKS